MLKRRGGGGRRYEQEKRPVTHRHAASLECHARRASLLTISFRVGMKKKVKKQRKQARVEEIDAHIRSIRKIVWITRDAIEDRSGIA